MARLTGMHHLVIGVCSMVLLASPGVAQTEDNSRAVRIIEDPPANAMPATPPQALQPPVLPQAVQPAEPPQPIQPPTALSLPVTPPPASTGPGQASLGAMPPPDLGALQSSLKASNAAGVVVEILPRAELQIGEKIALRVTTGKQGYLVLVDVDASGKLTQIYPNRRSLLTAQDAPESANLIKPGRPMTIPQVGNPFAGFEFVAAPPSGVAMVVAILSDRPVQMLDLPDIPPAMAGQGAAISFLSDWTRNLRIARTDASGGLEEAQWSFDAKVYMIQ